MTDQQEQQGENVELFDDVPPTAIPTIKNDVYTQTMESFLRVALAGFGGAVVGISLSKRGGLIVASTKKAKQVMRRGRYHHATRSDLPAQWAMACVAFAGIFEGTRALSPTSGLLRRIDEYGGDSNYASNKYACTIGDYAVGGAMAGTLLRGLPVAGARTGIAAPRLGAGLFAGLVLGIVPGIMVATITMLEDYLEASMDEEQEDAVEEAVEEEKDGSS
mmetsp:Transcript_15476/g.25807  ORF Transcript_15476/g.25807 Transcript_15476/m.25807 type:complete len:219 (-) Transcript_15476:3357-4013(-)